ncbi:MAG TPA: Gfo/Idh/MocA family oxidoreductase [Chthoniobacter sp.]
MKPKTILPRREFLITSTLALGGACLAAAAPETRLRIGFSGLKHGHVYAVMKLAAADPRVTIAAIADDDEQNRKEGERISGVPVKYANYHQMLESETLDVVVVCEEYGRRGEAAIAALEAGKHVFSDKPLCTRAEELERIATLAAAKHLEVHVDFSLRHFWAKGAELLQQGGIGEIVNCTFAGPHSLNYEHRPKWYFAPGMHGGIINDLMGHGVDFVQWIAKRPYVEVLSGACARVAFPQHPDFETTGDAFYQLQDGATVFGHVDYLSPAGHPGGWKCSIVGTKGDATVNDHDGFTLRPSGAAERHLEAKELRAESPHPFKDFIALLVEGKAPLRTTAESLHVSQATLLAQVAAESGKSHVPFPALAYRLPSKAG